MGKLFQTTSCPSWLGSCLLSWCSWRRSSSTRSCTPPTFSCPPACPASWRPASASLISPLETPVVVLVDVDMPSPEQWHAPFPHCRPLSPCRTSTLFCLSLSSLSDPRAAESSPGRLRPSDGWLLHGGTACSATKAQLLPGDGESEGLAEILAMPILSILTSFLFLSSPTKLFWMPAANQGQE